MNRTAIWILGVLAMIIVGIAVVLFFLHGSSHTVAPGSGGSPFSTTTTSTQTGQTIGVKGKDGREYEVPDFTQGKPSTSIGSSPEQVQYDVTPYPDYQPGQPYPTHAFDVAYDQSTSLFTITLEQEPLSQ